MRVIRATDMRRCEQPRLDAFDDTRLDAACVTIAGVTMELRTNVPGLAQGFAHRFSEHPADGPADFVYYVREDASGYALWCDRDGAWRWDGALPLDAIVFLTDAAAIAALVRYDDSLVSIHAAGVACHGIAAAIAADSTGGKTTTALACAQAGMEVYSDERVLLRDGVLHPFLRRVNVREGGAQLLGIEAGELSWRETFGAGAAAQPAPLRALFVIAGKGARPAVEAIDTSSAVSAIARWLDCKGDPLRRTAHAVSIVRSVRSFALTLGSPQDTARAIQSTLQASLVA